MERRKYWNVNHADTYVPLELWTNLQNIQRLKVHK